MGTSIKQTRKRLAGDDAGSCVFSCLGDLLDHYGRTARDRNAILAPGRAPLTYGGLWVQTNDVVRALRNVGVGRSGRVAVVLPEGPETATAIVGVAAGAVCVPLYAGYTPDEWQRYFSDLEIAALLTRADVELASRGVAHTLGIPVINLSPGTSGGSVSVVGSPRRSRRRTRHPLASTIDDAFILLTSGTTSRPKMVPLTHANVCLSAYNVGAALALTPQDRLLSVLPLFHGHGLISGLLAALAAGSSVVCTPGFDAASFFDWLTEFQPTWYTAVPAIHRAVLSEASRRKHRARYGSLRLIRSASSSLPPDVLGGLEATFGVPVIETYGMTEAATQIAANPLGRRKLSSVGKPAGAEIAIMDHEGQRLPAGEHGEIALRGATITRGYDKDAAATASAFREGWFRTGDLGYMDQDGYLFVVGRLKAADVINRGGQKVAPAEVEEALRGHPEVINAVAFPIAHTRLGEDVAAAVVLRPEAKVSAHSLRRFVANRLAAFKVPGSIRIVPEIPSDSSGRINRAFITANSTTLSKILVKPDGKRHASRSLLESQLTESLADLLELHHLAVDQDIFELGAELSYDHSDALASASALWHRSLLQGCLRCTKRCGPRGSPRVNANVSC